MGEVNKALGAAGAGYWVQVEDQGTVYRVGALTKKHQATFEAWTEMRARAAAAKAKDALDPDAYAELQMNVAERIAAGHYTWGAPGCQRFLRGDGFIFYLELALRQEHPAITRAEVESLVERHYKEFIAALEAMADAGKASPPPTTETGTAGA